MNLKKLRTVPGLYEEILNLDPHTGLTLNTVKYIVEHYCKPIVYKGNGSLYDLEAFIEVVNNGGISIAKSETHIEDKKNDSIVDKKIKGVVEEYSTCMVTAKKGYDPKIKRVSGF